MLLFGLAAMIFIVAKMMNVSSLGITSVGSEFQSMALKLSVGRLLIIGSAVLFGWGFIARGIAVYFQVEVGPFKYRVLMWYVLAEAVIIMSLFGM